MGKFYFVEDYEKHVASLMATHPIDEAMSLAVGGQYEFMGNINSEIVIYAGARDGMSILDFGCGSGRVAHALAKRVKLSRYLGTDVVQALLDYAATKTPSYYKYVCHRELSIPAEDKSFDVAYAFSVFTHLLQTDCFTYLKDIHRTLKPGGKLVLSFLELKAPTHWRIFEDSINSPQSNFILNMFIERDQLAVWCSHIGFDVSEFIDGTKPAWGGHAAGQAVAILEKSR